MPVYLLTYFVYLPKWEILQIVGFSPVKKMRENSQKEVNGKLTFQIYLFIVTPLVTNKNFCKRKRLYKESPLKISHCKKYLPVKKIAFPFL